MNGAYITAGLLFGKDDFYKTMEIAIRCGQDADCNASNAAALWGVIHGYDAIPDIYKEGIAAMEDKKFAFTDYSMNDAVDKVMEFMKENIERNGGKVLDDKLVIKTQEPGFDGECVQSFPGMVYKHSISCDSPEWTFTGEWERFTEQMDDAVYSQTVSIGASAETEFDGRMITIIGAWDSDCGIADIYIDGQKYRRSDSYFASRCGFSTINREVLFVASGLEAGHHTLKIVNSKDKNPKSSGNRLMFTRIDVYDEVL